MHSGIPIPKESELMRFLQAPISALLCLGLVYPTSPVLAQSVLPSGSASTTQSKARPAYRSTQLQGDARILHALNRFTFGPRPGDLEAVRSIGVDKWFEQQLHPSSLDQSDLNTRLAQFPAMQWSTEDLLFRLPSNAVIRQTIDGRLPIPERGALRAVYENQIYRVAARKQLQEQKKAEGLRKQDQTNPPPSGAMTSDATMNAASPADPTPMARAAQPDSASPSNTDANQTTMAALDSISTPPPVDESQIREVLDLAPQQRLARLGSMQPQAFDNFFKSLKPLQRLALVADLTPDQREVAVALENPQRLVNEELIAQRLTRDIYSNAQLQEVMTDFWLNHFNVYLHKNDETPYYLVSYERDVIRPRSLGKFEDLLEATAHSPAMLLYLDNAGSIGPDSLAADRAKFVTSRRPDAKAKLREGLNENYARELMELHTLGVNGGYTQADVTQVARVLTGWTVDRPQRGGSFRFEPNRHEPGTKLVLGKKIKDHGEEEGRELLHMLATRPATAQFIARKLAIRFVNDDPPQALVDRMAKAFLSSDGDIAVVLKTLFHSSEFFDSTSYRAKVKTPIEFVASAARASNANILSLLPLANAIREMGMPLYGCVTPNGYNWQSETWVSTNALVNRMNFALSLAANRLPGISVTWDTVQDTNGAADAVAASPEVPNPESEETRLESVLISGGVSDSTRSAVLQQFQQQSAQISDAASAWSMPAAARPRFRAQVVTARERQDELLAGLLLGSPEFQRR
jgi:uncharacterized protein (DUF1800 family)